ncbi:MAG: metalloregulator ArsR/SmtB family transcription factor [Candidatus Shapirobacteria bacterium]|nr:metalloregulator ArsR/SmtB family transcription factor [Candidatus Shapirobacteria bacterium]
MNMSSYKCCSTGSNQSKEVGELSALLKLISENSRLQILCILKNGEHCVCQLMEHTKLSQSLISHHLKDLKDADLVVDRKDSKWAYYSLTPKGTKITNLIFNINQ